MHKSGRDRQHKSNQRKDKIKLPHSENENEALKQEEREESRTWTSV
jgi:hypothetical protein